MTSQHLIPLTTLFRNNQYCPHILMSYLCYSITYNMHDTLHNSYVQHAPITKYI